MIRDDCPCYKGGKDCPKRTVHPNCHSTCPDYKEFHDKNTEEREAIRRKKAEEAMLTDAHIRAIKRVQKNKSKQTVWEG